MKTAKLKNDLGLLYRYTAAAMVYWVAVVAVSLIWNISPAPIHQCRESVQLDSLLRCVYYKNPSILHDHHETGRVVPKEKGK